MNKQKKFVAIGGAVAVVAIGGWMLLSSMASSRAEEQLQTMVDSMGLRDTVKWQNVSASPFGKVQVEGITVRPDRSLAPSGFTIKQVTIDDFKNTDSQKRGVVEVTDLANEQGFSPLGATDFIRAAGRTDLKPLSLKINWDFDTNDNDGVLELALEQPEAFNGNVHVKLGSVSGLVAFLQNAASQQPQDMLGLLGMGMMFGMPEPLRDLAIEKVEGKLRDEGYVQRSIALYKRHRLPVSSDKGSAAKQRNEAFKADVKEQFATCKDKDRLARLPVDADGCEALLEFVTGDSKTINLSMMPAKPVTVGQLFAEGMRRGPDQAVLLLNPELDN